MTAPRRERFTNNGVATLDGGIDGSQTTLDVDDGSVFPDTGNFRVVVDSEIMICTARTDETLTVTRGAEGSSAASHLNGATIAAVLTIAGARQTFADNIPIWAYTPALNRIVADDGLTVLTASDFTWVNQETASVADGGGSIVLTMPTTAGNDIRVLLRSAPSTPYAYIAAFQACIPRAGSTDAGQICMGFRESSTGELQIIQIGTATNTGPGTLVQNWTDATTFSANLRAFQSFATHSPVVWLRIEDNGTNLIKSVGVDGKNWIQLNSAGRTAFMAGGPDQIFWGGRNDNNGDNAGQVRLIHWSRES